MGNTDARPRRLQGARRRSGVVWGRTRRTVLPVALFVTLGAVRPALAAFEVADEGWEGTSALLRIARERLGEARVKPVATLEWDRLRPEDALLILHPQHELEYREASAFLAAGGRVGLLDDHGRGDLLLTRFRIHRIQAPMRPTETIRSTAGIAVAIPAVEVVAGAEHGRHPVVAAVDRVVTNHPTALRTEPGVRLTPVLEIPALGEPSSLLAVIGVIGDAAACGLVEEGARPVRPPTSQRERCGRLFAMGDPSAVINLMMRYPGNRTFAEGLIDYLVAGDTWGPRGGVLYIVANDFSQRGIFGGGNALKRSLTDRIQALRELLSDARRNGLPAGVAVALAALAALLAAVFTGRASLRQYPRTVPRYARPTPLVAQGGTAGRAAVLSAPTTHRALAVLEMKAALEEALRFHLNLPDGCSTRQILEETKKQRVLGPESTRSLDKLLPEMAKAEAAVETSERIRISPESVERMHRAMQAILSELSARSGGQEPSR